MKASISIGAPEKRVEIAMSKPLVGLVELLELDKDQLPVDKKTRGGRSSCQDLSSKTSKLKAVQEELKVVNTDSVKAQTSIQELKDQLLLQSVNKFIASNTLRDELENSISLPPRQASGKVLVDI
ncbi:hypothetical protein ACH5RR_013130 [Cinchona calisaya]|uniref:Uncharacterized protein n=1 Tax=Cinchona calisaya TaxID=153742 RepID=A0ABD2ZZN5_9GENT